LICEYGFSEVINGFRSAAKEVKVSRVIMEGYSRLADKEVESENADRELYLSLALTSYGRALAEDEAIGKDPSVFRLISLWFANADSPKVVALINDLLPPIPTYKFTSLMYQMAARLSTSGTSGARSPFAAQLAGLVTRCAREHPYHTVPILLALVNAEKDEVMANGAARKQSETSTASTDDRGRAAQRILAEIKSDNKQLAAVIEAMESVSEALIRLAYKVPPVKAGKVKNQFSSTIIVMC